MVSTRAGSYEVIRKLGRGQFGEVALGRRHPDGVLCALKFLRPGAQSRTMERELVAMQTLLAAGAHPNVVSLMDFAVSVQLPSRHMPGVSKERSLLVLELADGGSLFDFVVHTGAFNEQFARWIFRQLLSGLLFCHAAGVYHRDLKPENVLLDRNLQFRLADFGFAKPARVEDLLQTTLGTEMYMAPEVRARKQYRGAPADVWSLGATLFFMLTRAMPFPPPQASWYWNCIRHGRYDLFWTAHERVIPPLSDAVKDLLNRVFVMEPDARMTLEHLVAHPWVTAAPDPDLPELMAMMQARHRTVAALQAKLESQSFEEACEPCTSGAIRNDRAGGGPQAQLPVRLAVDSNPTLLMLFHRSLTLDVLSSADKIASAAPAA